MANLTSDLTIRLIDDVSAPAHKVAQALREAEARAKAITAATANTGLSKNFAMNLTRLGASARDVELVTARWKEYTREQSLAAKASDWTKTQKAGVAAWESTTIGALRQVRRETEFLAGAERRAGVEAERAASRETAALQRAEHQAAETRSRLGVGHAAASAIVGYTGVHAIMRGVEEAIKAGATLQERVAQLTTSGATPAEIAKARGEYDRFSKTHAGTLESDYLAGYKDARVIAPTEAFEMADLGARYRTALRNSGISSSETDVGNVMRIMDELGLKNMASREDFLNNFLKSQQAFGDQIKTETALSAYRNAKQSIYDWSPEFRNKYFPTLLQSSGQQGGTEMMTALNNYVGHHMQKTEIESLIAAGFVRPQDVKTDHGRTTFRDNAKLFEAGVFKSNIAQWAWDFHDAFMKRRGASEDKFGDLIAKMPRNMAALISFLIHNEQRIKRDAETLDKPVGLTAESNDALAHNTPAAWEALKESMDQLGATMTGPDMPQIGAGLTFLATEITSLNGWLKAHPVAATAGAVAGVGGALAGTGALAYGLMNGFGLKGSAVALNQAAGALDAAAGRLGVGGGVPGGVAGGTAGAVAGTEGATGGFAAWKAAQQLSPITTTASRFWTAAAEIVPKLTGVIGSVLWLHDLGELINPTTKEGAPYRLDTATADWRERFERATRAEKELHQGADMEAHRGSALGRLSAPKAPVRPWPPHPLQFGRAIDAQGALLQAGYLPGDLAREAFRESRRGNFGEAPGAGGPSRMPPLTDEELAASRGAQAGMRQGADMEAHRGAAKAAFDALNTTIAPKVDTSAIDALIAKLHQAAGLLSGLGATGAAAAGSTARSQAGFSPRYK